MTPFYVAFDQTSYPAKFGPIFGPEGEMYFDPNVMKAAEIAGWKTFYCLLSKEDLVQLIIDSRKFSNLFDNSDILLQIEKHSRNLCYKLYNKR